jgi:hypothetical protein
MLSDPFAQVPGRVLIKGTAADVPVGSKATPLAVKGTV